MAAWLALAKRYGNTFETKHSPVRSNEWVFFHQDGVAELSADFPGAAAPQASFLRVW